ncbi:MAG: hypothetical protein K2M17_04560 [Bacilli bacterium]|nr:hypothetical protein [Bacilli bacterium]
MNIDIDLDALKAKKDEVMGLTQDFYTELGKVNSVVDSMANSWESDTFTQFKTKMGGFISDMNSVVSSIKSYNDFINSYIDIHSALDTQYSQKDIKIK